jgi:hypothetical protein
MKVLAWTTGELSAPLRERMLALHPAHLELVERRLERHLEGNHLLRNSHAMMLGMHAWHDPDAPHSLRWRKIYFDELVAQTDADGMHEERTPMYHVRALRDALEALATLDALGVEPPPPVVQRVSTMAQHVPWLRRMDGTLFPLNDSMYDHGIDLDRIVEQASSILGHTTVPPSGVRYLPSAGLVIAVDRLVGDRLAIDVGAPGPAHQPGHAHAGALSLELDLGGSPLLVDPGCSGYDGDPFRSYFRSTPAHNTATVDGKDQSEMWATFRVARRATVWVDEVHGGTGDLLVRGSCRPYHDASVCHRRAARRDARRVRIEDQILGGTGKRVELHWHLHPDWAAELVDSTVSLRHPSGLAATLRLDGFDGTSLHKGEDRPHLGWCARGFAHAVPTWTVRGIVGSNDHRMLHTSIEPGA